ncbi:MAG TPA: hypothetical protein VFA76_09605 [Terriglobales bacterium]|nr:hypothetical protein [Terriglobales bacterium]
MTVKEGVYVLEPSEGELVLEFEEGGPVFYRQWNGRVEFRTAIFPWRPLASNEVQQHLILDTPVADWLQRRLPEFGLEAAA